MSPKLREALPPHLALEQVWSEHDHQARLIDWCRDLHTDSRAALIFAIPNGSHKSFVMAGRFQREGLTSGVPDLFLPVAAQGQHGLFIEMKKLGGQTSRAQREWQRRLSAQGYQSEVCVGWRAAQAVIQAYLGLHP